MIQSIQSTNIQKDAMTGQTKASKYQGFLLAASIQPYLIPRRANFATGGGSWHSKLE